MSAFDLTCLFLTFQHSFQHQQSKSKTVLAFFFHFLMMATVEIPSFVVELIHRNDVLKCIQSSPNDKTGSYIMSVMKSLKCCSGEWRHPSQAEEECPRGYPGLHPVKTTTQPCKVLFLEKKLSGKTFYLVCGYKQQAPQAPSSPSTARCSCH